jgi:hypothetical protein
MKALRLRQGYANLAEVLERDIGEQGEKCEELTTAIGRAGEVIGGIIAS